VHQERLARHPHPANDALACGRDERSRGLAAPVLHPNLDLITIASNRPQLKAARRDNLPGQFDGSVHRAGLHPATLQDGAADLGQSLQVTLSRVEHRVSPSLAGCLPRRTRTQLRPSLLHQIDAEPSDGTLLQRLAEVRATTCSGSKGRPWSVTVICASVPSTSKHTVTSPPLPP